MKTACLSILSLLIASGFAGASLSPVFEYSFPASYDGSGFTWTDQSTAGNNAHTHNDVPDKPLTDDRPLGFDAALMSISGSTGTHGRSDDTALLPNAAVAADGGFTFDVWFKWEGTHTTVRKLIDYAGTEFLRTNDSEIQFGLSNADTLLRHPIDANQWYHAVAVFDTAGNAAEPDPNYPGQQRVMGNAYLYIDGLLVDFANDVFKTGFGDSLDRTIGLNQWPNGGDWNQG